MQCCPWPGQPPMDRRVQECNVRAQDALQRLEAEAYYAVYRALAASVMDWVRRRAGRPHCIAP